MPDPTDLHQHKDSHLSLPVAANLEFHLRNEALTSKCKEGEHYFIVVPCVCTSYDDETTRFKQEGSLKEIHNPHGSLEKMFKGYK